MLTLFIKTSFMSYIVYIKTCTNFYSDALVCDLVYTV